MIREKLIKECDEMSQLKGVGDTNFYASISRELKKAEKEHELLTALKSVLSCFYDTELHEFASSVEINNKYCGTEEQRQLIKDWLEK